MAMRSNRRAPLASTRRSRRPIDKKMTTVLLSNIVAGQQTVNLINGITYPGTITGLRWSLSVTRSGGTSNTTGNFAWAIVLLPAGTTVSTLNIGAGNSMYDPEQMVLAYGNGNTFNGAAGASSNLHRFDGSTKSMRKLKAGDSVLFLAFGTATERHDLFGGVQWFFKT